MFKKNKKANSYEEDIIELNSDEEVESYMNDYYNNDDYEISADEDEYEYEEETKTEQLRKEEAETTNEVYLDEYEEFEEDDYKTRRRGFSGIIRIIFTIIMILLTMIVIDVICVAKFNVGPFFALPLHKYNDGGTKECYGIGYKVIKYNQLQGRRDKELGFWSLKYDTNPTTIQAVDLAIEMNGKEIETYQKYNKKFLRVIGTLQSVDKSNNQITIGYNDDGKKYSLNIVCDIVKDQTNINTFKKGQEITVIGTVKDFKNKTDTTPRTFYLKNCFAEQ